jgi:Predicted dehydrogenases and related proteins
VKIALLGVSHWHMPLFLEPLLQEKKHEIVGVSDTNPVVARAYAEKIGKGCKAFTSFKDLCLERRPDFAFSLAPHNEMPALASFLMDEGIPFSIEKPAGVRLADVEALASKAEAKGSFVAIPFVFRYTGFMQAIRERAKDETVHNASFRLIAGPPSRYIEAGCEWMLDPLRSGGGCGINLAVHFLDMAVQFWNPSSISVASAMTTNSSSGVKVEDHFFAGLRSGAKTCLVETGYLYPAPVGVFDMHFSVRTDSHYFAVQGPGKLEIADFSGNREFLDTTTTNMPHYPTFTLDTLDRLEAGRPPVACLKDMVPVMRLVEAAYGIAGALPTQSR